MNRFKLLSEFLANGELNKAYKVLFNYYSPNELYKGEFLKTLLLVDQYNNNIIEFEDVARSLNIIVDGKHSKISVRFNGDGLLNLCEGYNATIKKTSFTN